MSTGVWIGFNVFVVAMLILDLAVFNRDAHEISLKEALERLMAGRTTFVIAHRLSTIRSADQLLVLEQGQIVERAESTSERSAHDILLAQNGVYAGLYRRQFREAAPELPVYTNGYHPREAVAA